MAIDTEIRVIKALGGPAAPVTDATVKWDPNPRHPALHRATVHDEPGKFNWHFTRYSPGSEVPLHANEFINCVYVAAGSIELNLEGSVTRLEAGDCCVLKGDRSHGWRAHAT